MTIPALIPRPTPRQLAWQRAGLGMFCHFGANTFHDREWSDGSLPAESFMPSALDAGAWVRSAVDAGMRYLVLTAKHHDGFCLWPTETTDYSVRSSPWRGGRGDVVQEVASACAAAGIGFGLYLSPWDRNAPCYSDPRAYDDFYVRQLTELCTRYGELFEVWFDGAGSEGRTYDWDRIMGVVEEYQPNAMVFNMGRPSIRWIGNEDGLAADPVWYVVDSTEGNTSGARSDWLAGYLPPECDVPIRSNWFWQTDDRYSLKSLRHLLAIYYRSIGLGAGLLLNVPPDRRGLLDDADAERLAEFGKAIAESFAEPTPAVLDQLEPGLVRARFDRPVSIDHLELIEDLTDGQRISTHRIMLDREEIVAGQTVGIRRLHAFGQRTAGELMVRLTGESPRLSAVNGYRTGRTRIPELEPQPERQPGKVR